MPRFGMMELLLIMQFVERFESLLGAGRMAKILYNWSAFCIGDGIMSVVGFRFWAKLRCLISLAF